MITERMYDTDAYIKEFEAEVLSCEKEKDFYKTVLDKTCFFPEAGGQPSDIGKINGSDVFDVQIEDGEILHFTKVPFETGQKVKGEIDFDRRFCFMQNHSGEHIVSGIVHKISGLQNVGFHLNTELVTLDFDGILTEEQIENIENLANRVVWNNKNIKCYYPSKAELNGIEFRQKKEISGDIRLVEIEDTDICACCAPHVKKTGEIGIIKFLGSEKMRGGTRITMKCGSYALKDFQNKYANNLKIQNLLSAKPEETAEAVANLLDKISAEKQKYNELNKKYILMLSEFIQIKKSIFVDGFDMKDLQVLADLLHKKSGEIIAVFSENGSGFNFVICGDAEKTDLLFKEIKEKLNIRGGGRNGMIQGTVLAEKEEIIRSFG